MVLRRTDHRRLAQLPRILDDFKVRRFPPLIDTLVRTGPFGLFDLGKEEYGYQELPEVTLANVISA